MPFFANISGFQIPFLGFEDRLHGSEYVHIYRTHFWSLIGPVMCVFVNAMFLKINFSNETYF
jgi:hypothetical protein